MLADGESNEGDINHEASRGTIKKFKFSQTHSCHSQRVPQVNVVWIVNDGKVLRYFFCYGFSLLYESLNFCRVKECIRRGNVSRDSWNVSTINRMFPYAIIQRLLNSLLNKLSKEIFPLNSLRQHKEGEKTKKVLLQEPPSSQPALNDDDEALNQTLII